MKKLKAITCSVFLAAIVHTLAAQSFNFSTAKTWAAQPTLHKINPQYDSFSAVGILDERLIEYRTEKTEIFIYTYTHRIAHVVNDKGIEMFNKIYIPAYRNTEISDIKARAVLPNGKVIEVDNSRIKETEEDGDLYKIFAVDGLEKGAEVEYTFTSKRNLSIFGSEVFQRSNIPYQQARFLLATPAHLKFDAKGYNGFKVSKDSVIDEERIIAGYSENVGELEDEKYAFTNPFLQRVDYKLSYNLSTGEAVRLYTWKDFAKQAYTVYTSRTPKEDKALEGFIKKINISEGSDPLRILAVEDYIKTNINIDRELIAEDADNLEYIIKNKAANDEGITRLFAGVFEKAGIQFQLVFASDRTSFGLDNELENWNRASDIIIYFPATEKYISPLSTELRYPYIPYQLAATRGLFLKGTTIGALTTAIGIWNTIKMEPFEEHAHNMESTVEFNAGNDTLIIKSRQVLKGYGATNYRPIYTFLPKDRQEEISKEIVRSVAGNENISNIEVENKALTDYFSNKPLVISADIKSTELLERAGNKILLKIGEIIGPQVEMYQEKPRVLPVQLPYPHVLNRTIIVKIPEGYTIKNPGDININIVHTENGVSSMGFASSYTLQGSTLTIQVNETYRDASYPLAQFEDFKKVINASADFNKVVLVLEKK